MVQLTQPVQRTSGRLQGWPTALWATRGVAEESGDPQAESNQTRSIQDLRKSDSDKGKPGTEEDHFDRNLVC